MIPSIITDTSITFIANGRPWTMSSDHPKFGQVKDLLSAGSDDVDTIVKLSDVRVAVDSATSGAAALTEDGLFLNGKKLPPQWASKAHESPDEMKILLVNTGDVVRVEGDEDAEDGIYTVGEVDNTDTAKRVYVESEEGFFGFVSNSAIKEVIEKAENPPEQDWAETEVVGLDEGGDEEVPYVEGLDEGEDEDE